MMVKIMEARSSAKYMRVSPRKTRLVAKNIIGLSVESAINILTFTPNKPAGIILDVVRSAIANAEHNVKMDIDRLFIKKVVVDEGPTWKRFMPRAQGRATHIRKRTSHVTVIVSEEQE